MRININLCRRTSFYPGWSIPAMWIRSSYRTLLSLLWIHLLILLLWLCSCICSWACVLFLLDRCLYLWFLWWHQTSRQALFRILPGVRSGVPLLLSLRSSLFWSKILVLFGMSCILFHSTICILHCRLMVCTIMFLLRILLWCSTLLLLRRVCLSFLVLGLFRIVWLSDSLLHIWCRLIWLLLNFTGYLSVVCYVLSLELRIPLHLRTHIHRLCQLHRWLVVLYSLAYDVI